MQRLRSIWVGVVIVVLLYACAAPASQAPTVAPTQRISAAVVSTPAPTIVAATATPAPLPIVYFMDAYG